jgi:hypothetical protein
MPRTKPPAASQVSEGITLEDALIKWGDPGSVQEFMTLEAEGYDGRHGLLLWFPELPRSVREKKTLQSLKLREQLKTQILGKLQRGELVAIAYDSRAPLDGDPVIIPADRWRVLKANFHESSARGENFAVTGILVYQGKPLGSPKAAVQGRSRPPSCGDGIASGSIGTRQLEIFQAGTTTGKQRRRSAGTV